MMTVDRITKTFDICGGDACLRGTRVTVWGLEEYRRLGLGDEEIRRRVVGLTRDDLAMVWEYVRQHPEEIDQAIRANQEG